MILLLEMSGAHTHWTLTGKFPPRLNVEIWGTPECAASTVRPGSPDDGGSWLAPSSLHHVHLRLSSRTLRTRKIPAASLQIFSTRFATMKKDRSAASSRTRHQKLVT